MSERMAISLRSDQWDLIVRAVRHLERQANVYGSDPVVQVCRDVVMARCGEALIDIEASAPNAGKD